MTAYYNEIDPYAAQWLRNLIAGGHIAPGIVDERSIEDVTPNDLRGFTQCHWFAGIAVWSYALRRAGWSDDKPVWTGSCPCQPFSAAGKGDGFADERHLWPHLHYLIEQCNPSVVFGEQVASKDGLSWLDLVQTDLEASRYAVGAVDSCAAGFGSPHIRQRLYWVADRTHLQDRTHEGKSKAIDASPVTTGRCDFSSTSLPGKTNGFWSDCEWLRGVDGRLYPVESGSLPLVDGSTRRVGRISAYGNGLVTGNAIAFIESFMEVTA
ncbi:DNA cytosine methyltransferase [Enterobacterales bacterium CwR94]|nr:DNA cytosine methyltransferase [Enterobacterales bacterium CwR94]